MKKIQLFFFAACFSMLCLSELQAQVSMVYSIGISPQQTPGGPYIFVNRSSPKNEFAFDLAQVKASYFVGAGVRYTFAPFFLMTEAQYNKREYIYNVEPTYPGFGRTEETIQYTESMHVINVPVSLGVDLGVMEVISGFVPQIIAGHQTDLDNLSGYSEKLKTIRFGWHTGLAAKIANVRLGLDYQMDFNNYADHIYINGQNLGLNGTSNRIVGSIAYVF